MLYSDRCSAAAALLPVSMLLALWNRKRTPPEDDRRPWWSNKREI